MAQAEDTELRDLVIEALEKNGSLAKIRALLRANIFLAFEDECGNMKQNVNLDSILKQPEGVLALSVIHEFLEFCRLNNTLFVYMSESRQGNEYNYDGRKTLIEKLNIPKSDTLKEPILLTLLKHMLKFNNKKSFDSNISGLKTHDKCDEKNYGDDQNCTYILHEDSQSSTTSNTNSDNSSDEKNKLHLRLQLDNSDTDTSSDFARDKSSSEYVPGDHILESTNLPSNLSNFISQTSNDFVGARTQNNFMNHIRSDKEISVLNNEFKTTNSTSDSTSYIDLKPCTSLDEKMLNTAGLPIVDLDTKNIMISQGQFGVNTKNDLHSPKSATLSYISPKSNKENEIDTSNKKSPGSIKSDGETGDFSYGDDFSISSVSKLRDITENQQQSQKTEMEKNRNKTSTQSPRQVSQTSQSSVSLSEVTDLISGKKSIDNANKSVPSLSVSKDKVDNKSSKLYSDDSGDFTESPVPSLSNLSLDIHSD